ncbi:hypothetical protein HAQ00_09340 [Acidithiobacillus caldus ATCC 51756]|uniref:hypothetical protein n=1 Tax=Acidithiobacillus caldus TaxID=33059 RepID=UPI001C074E02|nr:hypothetical protein [Acidithiobacillus caldus]MBU2735923.1 hypothetical protein [Acidithiobacillus caldus ATCC 51756]MBU2803155.1 hypothetical protein [Acidithiobacillus caldus]
MSKKTITITGDDGIPKQIIALSERIQMFYEKFPRERYTWRMEQIPLQETNPVLAALANADPAAVKDILKVAPAAAFKRTVQFRCTLRDDLLGRDLGSATAYGEYYEYKDVERIESAAFSRMIALVAGIGMDDQDDLIQADALLCTKGNAKGGSQEPKAATRNPNFSLQNANAERAEKGKQQPATQPTSEPHPKAATESAATDPVVEVAGPESPTDGENATQEVDGQEHQSLFFLLPPDLAKEAARIAAQYDLDANALASHVGSDSVKIRRILKESKKVETGTLTREQFRAMVQEKCEP